MSYKDHNFMTPENIEMMIYRDYIWPTRDTYIPTLAGITSRA